MSYISRDVSKINLIQEIIEKEGINKKSNCFINIAERGLPLKIKLPIINIDHNSTM